MSRAPRVRTRALVAIGLALAVGLAAAAAPFASTAPGGLERVAAEQGFAGAAETGGVQAEAPAPAYAFPGIGNERVATGAAGLAGTLAVFALAIGVAHVPRRGSGSRHEPAGGVAGAS